jgi:hypothetical protein
MLGQLPKTLEINGVEYAINTDYRNILQIFTAYNADELSDREKVYICMRRLFVDLPRLPRGDFEEAYRAAIRFIECNVHDDKPSPKVVNWEKDEQLIFPAINKVAGMEVRAVPYMHWWTFLGYFQAIDREDIWGFILTIRQKKAKHKPLEKHEKEFYNANRDLCQVEFAESKETAEDALADIFQSLLKGGDG